MGKLADAFVEISPRVEPGGIDRAARESGDRFGHLFLRSSTGPLKALGAVAGGLFAVDKVKDFFSESISEARDAQRTANITANVIRSTGGAAHVSAGQVNELAEAIQKKSGVDHDAVQSGANLLLTFTGVRNEVGKGNDIFDRATQAITDMGAAMHGTPTSAAIQLGKALNDPAKGLTALTRVGVTFTDQQRKQISTLEKSGHTVDAQKVILHELGKEFGGTAAAASNSGDRLGNAFKDLKEQVGDQLLPYLDKGERAITTKVIPAFATFLDQMQSGDGAGGRFAASVKELAGDIASAAKPTEDLIRDGGKLLGVIDGLPSPVKKVGAEVVIGALVFSKLQSAALSAGTALRVTGEDAIFTAEALSTVEGRAVAAQAVMGGLGRTAKLAAGAAGLALLANASQQSSDKLSILEGASGGALTGLAVGGPLAAGIGGIAGGLYGLKHASDVAAHAFQKNLKFNEDYAGSFDDITGAVTRATRQVVFRNLQNGGQLGIARALGIPDRDEVQAALGNIKALDRVRQRVRELTSGTKANRRDGEQPFFNKQSASDYINSLRTMGSELTSEQKAKLREIQATKTWTQALHGVPKKVQTTLASEGYRPSLRQINDLTRHYKLTPHEVRTIIKATGTEASVRNIAGVTKAVKSVGQAVPDLDPFQRGLKSGTAKAQRAATSGGADLARTLRKSTTGAVPNLDPFQRGVRSGIASAKGPAHAGGVGVGQALESGVIAGFAPTQARLTTAARLAISATLAAARKAADAHSPSRKMAALGRDMGDGLILGLHARQGAAAKAGDKLAKAILADVAKGSDGVSDALDKLSSYVRDHVTGKGQGKRENAILGSLKDQYAALVANGKAQDANNAKLDVAKSKLADLIQTRTDYSGTVRAGVVDFGNVTGIGAGDGTAGILAGLQGRLTQARTFAANIATLTKDHLNNTSLQQIVDAGVSGGYNTADALAHSSKAQLAQINALAGQISAQGKSLGAKTSSTFYDAGVQAQQGLVDGLTADSSKLKHAADVLATELVRAVKHKLKIKSPSQVFRGLGRQTAQGLQLGLRDVDFGREGSALAGRLTDGWRSPRLDLNTYAATSKIQYVGGGRDQELLNEIRAMRKALAVRSAPLAAGDLVIKEYLDVDRVQAKLAFRDRAATI